MAAKDVVCRSIVSSMASSGINGVLVVGGDQRRAKMMET
jgi:hypothetical protein